jgi:hypothetical protein
MDTIYKEFYRSFYQRTGGYLPTAPLDTSVFPGDFFQIRSGQIVPLGNVFQKGIIDAKTVQFTRNLKLNPTAWTISEGVSKPYSGRGSGHSPLQGEFEYSRQVLAFGHRGSFQFKGNGPEALKITNWNDIAQALIIKLTSALFSFRELYVVTESVSTSDWTLAVSGSEKGELEIASDSESSGMIEIFGHQASKTIQSKEIEYYHREHQRKPGFYKAKKLTVSPEIMQVFISQLIDERMYHKEWISSFFDYDLSHESAYPPSYGRMEQASPLDMLQAGELNPNTSLLYFTWTDMNTDDIEKLFMEYGA